MVTSQRQTQERSRRRREQLIDATIELISAGGLRAVTHRAVSAQAGLTSAAAGYYFKTVDELLQAALHRLAQARAEQLRTLLDEAITSAEDLPGVARHIALALVMSATPDTLAQFEVYLEAARNPALRDSVHAAMRDFEAMAAGRLAGLGVATPERAAKAFMAVANGFAVQRLANPLSTDEDVDLLRLTLTGLYLAFALDADQIRNVLVELNLEHFDPAG